MKFGFKIFLIIFSIILFSEFIEYLSKTTFFDKYVTSLNQKNREYIASVSKLSGIESNYKPKDYSSILPETTGISFSKTTRFKFRPPVSEFIYDNAYLIEITRIDSNSTIDLKRDVYIQDIESTQQLNVGYAIEHNGFFKFEYNNTLQPHPLKIFLSMDGLETRLLNKSDSTLCYSSNLNNMSVRYNKNTDQSLFISSVASYTPLEFLIYKKQNNLYLIIATVINKNTSLNGNLLYDLIHK